MGGCIEVTRLEDHCLWCLGVRRAAWENFNVFFDDFHGEVLSGG